MIRRPVREDGAPFFVISAMDIVQQGYVFGRHGNVKTMLNRADDTFISKINT